MTGTPGMSASAEAGAATPSVPVVRERSVVNYCAIADGEVVILELKPHPLFIVLSVLGPVVASGVCAGFLWWMSGRVIAWGGAGSIELPRLGGWWAAPAMVGVLALVWQTLEWCCRWYVLTDRRIVRVSGVLRQVVVEVPLARVQQVMMYKSLRERLFALGTPGVSSAGSGGASYVFWNMVSRPEERMKVMRETIDRYTGNGHAGGAHG